MDPTLFEGLFAEILAPLINGTLSKLSDGAKAQWKKVGDKQAAAAYKAKLIKRYGTIQILGQPRPQKLGKVYTDVYLHEKPTHSYAMQVEKLEEMFREQNKRFGRSERTDGLAFAKEHDRLFILGKPGAGKTTFLKYLTMQAAVGDIPRIPIFVSLNDFQHQKVDLLDYLAEQFDVCDFPEVRPFIEQLLKKGKGLILFDGLDEVSKEDSQRSTITRQLRQFITKYDSNQFAITCRIAASDYQFQNFAYVETADFNDKQVDVFVRKWFANSESKSNSFLKELKSLKNEGIKEMMASPLLLTLLCIQFGASEALPSKRSAIYEKSLRVLLKLWDNNQLVARDNYRNLSVNQKTELLSRVAYRMFWDNNLFIEQKLLEVNLVRYMEKIFKGSDQESFFGEDVLKAVEIQHGLLVERSSGVYSFSHLTLQEYFTARYIVDFDKRGVALSSLIGVENLQDTRWREVFLFVAELLPNGDEFVQWMAEELQDLANTGSVKTLIAWGEQRSIEQAVSKRKMISRISFILRAIENAYKNKEDHSKSVDRYLDLALKINIFPAEPLDKAISTMYVNALLHTDDMQIPFNDVKFNHYKAKKIAIDESKSLKWPQLTAALKQIPHPKPNDSIEKWRAIADQIEMIMVDIILDGWEWGSAKVEDFNLKEAWLEGHKLLVDCLDRVNLKHWNLQKFEDEYLYRLPPHARPQLGDAS